MESNYTLNILLAAQKQPGHFILNTKECSVLDLEGKIFPVRFDIINEPTFPSFLQLDTTEYPIYGSDGETFLSLLDLNNAVVFLTFNNDKWQLVKTIFRSNENVGHILFSDNNLKLPNRPNLKLEHFDIEDCPMENSLKLSNPIWSMKKIEGIKGVINEYQWYPLYGDRINAPKNGNYKITVNLWLNNIEHPCREIGIKVDNIEDWFVQQKRLRHSFVVVGYFKQGDSLTPAVYVDKLSTSDTINIEECSFYIECLNTQEI